MYRRLATAVALVLLGPAVFGAAGSASAQSNGGAGAGSTTPTSTHTHTYDLRLTAGRSSAAGSATPRSPIAFACQVKVTNRPRGTAVTYSGITVCNRRLYQDGQATLWNWPFGGFSPVDSARRFAGVMALGSSVGVFRSPVHGWWYNVNYNIDVVAPAGDVWLSLPSECEGVGSWLATCGFTDLARFP